MKTSTAPLIQLAETMPLPAQLVPPLKYRDGQPTYLTEEDQTATTLVDAYYSSPEFLKDFGATAKDRKADKLRFQIDFLMAFILILSLASVLFTLIASALVIEVNLFDFVLVGIALVVVVEVMLMIYYTHLGKVSKLHKHVREVLNRRSKEANRALLANWFTTRGQALSEEELTIARSKLVFTEEQEAEELHQKATQTVEEALAVSKNPDRPKNPLSTMQTKDLLS